MNFLAHIYLSNNDDQITIGNFIADGIRGKRYVKYPVNIQKGILLHRQIDTFTDAHPTVRLSTKRLHENYGHYSGVIVDILYDHFLAKNWDHYSDIPLDKYIAKFYDLLEEHFEILPIRIQKMMPYMIADNWLLSYAKIEGIQKVLDGMNRRTKNKSGMNTATIELQEYYTEFEEEFTSFFEELIIFSTQTLQDIETNFSNEN
ncbi:ACP phosphodiesterase [Psychroserpens sp. Hel_I_66]|uniref:acyl carrier protein phosphodiesterase n=1 Tax=Psychroserpens sp. Hel_I_66 TaxID=1250004 RepID=UPI00064884E0|nr:acyl carrier protein phosphodiesterase [Psychroserpens sp. Hel_I_66]